MFLRLRYQRKKIAPASEARTASTPITKPAIVPALRLFGLELVDADGEPVAQVLLRVTISPRSLRARPVAPVFPIWPFNIAVQMWEEDVKVVVMAIAMPSPVVEIAPVSIADSVNCNDVLVTVEFPRSADEVDGRGTEVEDDIS